MGAGSRHVSVGTVHVAAGHAVVFETTREIEDAAGQKHSVNNENRVIPWTSLRKVAQPEDLALLEALGSKLLALEQRLETMAKEAAKKVETKP